MPRNPCYYELLVLLCILPATFSFGPSFNHTACAERASQLYFNNPSQISLYDQHGRHTTILADAWGISYASCKALCGTRDNFDDYSWDLLSQGIGSWLIPWLALSAQLPFETKNKTTNIAALLLTLGSPALAAYSLALTLLNARRVNRKFRHVREENQWVHHPLQYKAIKAARSILIETQHVPIQIWNGRRREISQLVVHPENWLWWCSLRRKLLMTKRKWTYSLYAQVGWVCVSQLLAIIDFFTAKSIADSSIDIGLAINSLWLWMIPIVLGWVYVGTQNSAESVKAALTDTDVPTLGSERYLKGECIGFRDRTAHDYSSVSLQHSLDSNEPPRNESSEGEGPPRFSDSALDNAAVVSGHETEEEYTSPISIQDAHFRHQGPSSPYLPKAVRTSTFNDIELKDFKLDPHAGTSSNLQATKQESQPALNFQSPLKLLPQTFMGFSIAGDDYAPGPIHNYARVWTHTNAIDRITESFLMLTHRQQQQETVDGSEWETDPKRWKMNLKGTPEQMSRYLSPLHEDLKSIPLHVPASSVLTQSCITAAFIAMCLQWGTTGAAIFIAYK